MNSQLADMLLEQKSLLISVSTGGPRIQEKQDEYENRRKLIRRALEQEGLPDPVPFSDLWQWYGKWSDGTLPTYKLRRQYISELIQPVVDFLLSNTLVPDIPQAPQQKSPNMPKGKIPIDIFISHCSADSHLAELLANLFRNSYSLDPARIRCTSVDGYRLGVGENTNDKLRIEVREARVFVALLTPNSLISTYVLFEMGARWGAGQYFAPVIAGGLSPGNLKAPVSGLNVLDLASRSQVSQLLENIGEELELSLVSRASFETSLTGLSDESSKTIFDPNSLPFSIVRASWGAPGSEIDVTHAVRAQVRNNRLAAQAYGPALAANDPAFGRPKRLFLEYDFGTERKTVSIPEGSAECVP